MNIEKKLADAINAQINAEYWSAYLYLSMSVYFQKKGLSGIANWFKVQFNEEQAHAEIFIDYVLNRGGEVRLEALAPVKQTWDSVAEAFADTLAHENEVTKRIHALYSLAEDEKDYASRQMLNWYIAEQVEEEANVQGILDKLQLIGDNGVGLLQLDSELASRTFTAPQVG